MRDDNAPAQAPTVAACFGGGGAFGIGFNMGVARALLDAGVPITAGPMLGTSAGAWTAAALAVGAGLDDVLRSWDAAPTSGKARVIELTRRVFGTSRDARVSTMAIRLPFPRRVLLSGREHDLADLVAASSSPPRVAEPHRLNGQRYMDAGVVTTTSVNRTPRADLLVLVAPMAGPVAGRMGQYTARVVTYELMQWRLGGGRVLFVRPSRAVGALAGSKATDVLERDRAQPAHDAGYDLGARCAERFRNRHPQLAGDLGM